MDISISKAQKLVEKFVFSPLDEMIARRKLKHFDDEIERFLSTCDLSQLMRIKQRLDLRLDQIEKEEKE